MDFLGARYYSKVLKRDHQIFLCRRYVNRKRVGFQTDWNTFHNEIRPRIRKENPEASHSQITHLVGQAWREQPLTEKCPGMLKFEAVNGHGILSANGLLDFVEHCASCEFHATNSRLKQIVKQKAKPRGDLVNSRQSGEPKARRAGYYVHSRNESDGLDKFHEADPPSLVSSSGARLSVVYDEVYPEEKHEIREQKPILPIPVPSEPEMEYVLIDD